VFALNIKRRFPLPSKTFLSSVLPRSGTDEFSDKIGRTKTEKYYIKPVKGRESCGGIRSGKISLLKLSLSQISATGSRPLAGFFIYINTLTFCRM